MQIDYFPDNETVEKALQIDDPLLMLVSYLYKKNINIKHFQKI